MKLKTYYFLDNLTNENSILKDTKYSYIQLLDFYLNSLNYLFKFIYD